MSNKDHFLSSIMSQILLGQLESTLFYELFLFRNYSSLLMRYTRDDLY